MINIISTFVAEPMRYSLEYLLRYFNQEPCQFIYNQLFQQLLVMNSELHENKKGKNILLIRLVDLFQISDFKNIVSDSRQCIIELQQALTSAKTGFQFPLIIIITPSPSCDDSISRIYKNTEKKLQKWLAKDPQFLLIKLDEIRKLYPVECVLNLFSDKQAHIPYTFEFYISLSIIIVRKCYLVQAKPYKVIVLDCDGTLWKGIVEEDGSAEISITPREKYFQKFILDKYRKGFLLCLCSKNSEGSVIEVFEKRPDMLINLNRHIIGHRINWKNKSENIKSLSCDLNLALESFIFIDDNPLECAEVQANCPEVLSITLPKKMIDSQTLLKHVWAFDRLKISHEDTQRTDNYKLNINRNKLLIESSSYAIFLKNLNLEVTIYFAEVKDVSRILQLSQRTNQFNVNPQKIDINILQSRISNREGCLAVRAKDKFGDYGLIGVIIYETLSCSLKINTFLLSCRALGKGIEYKMLKTVSEAADAKSLTEIEICFLKTEKNEPAIQFLKQFANMKELSECGSIYLSTSKTKQDQIFLYSPAIQHNSPSININKKNINIQENNYNLLKIAEKFQSVDQIILQLNNEKENFLEHLASHHVSEPIHKSLLTILRKYNVPVKNENISLSIFGIDSLKAVLISSEIYQQYQIEIDYVEIMKSSMTVRQFLNKISSKIAALNKAINSPIIENYKPILRYFCIPGTPVLIFVPPAGGCAYTYATLANHIGKFCSVCALESYNLYSGMSIIDNLNSLAKKYVEYIQNEFADNSFFLCGWSIGGMLAFEIAQQLAAAGNKVLNLYFLDSVVKTKDDNNLIDELLPHIRQSLMNDISLNEFNSELKKKIVNVRCAETILDKYYQPTTYFGNSILFKATKIQLDVGFLVKKEVKKKFLKLSHSYVYRPLNGWGNYINNIREVKIQATHRSIMEKNSVELVAKVINEDIENKI